MLSRASNGPFQIVPDSHILSQRTTIMASDSNDNQPTSTFEEGKGTRRGNQGKGTSMPAGEGVTTKGKTGGRRGRKCWKGTHRSGETPIA
jgi:hypothetical protein